MMPSKPGQHVLGNFGWVPVLARNLLWCSTSIVFKDRCLIIDCFVRVLVTSAVCPMMVAMSTLVLSARLVLAFCTHEIWYLTLWPWPRHLRFTVFLLVEPLFDNTTDIWPPTPNNAIVVVPTSLCKMFMRRLKRTARVLGRIKSQTEVLRPAFSLSVSWAALLSRTGSLLLGRKPRILRHGCFASKKLRGNLRMFFASSWAKHFPQKQNGIFEKFGAFGRKISGNLERPRRGNSFEWAI